MGILGLFRNVGKVKDIRKPKKPPEPYIPFQVEEPVKGDYDSFYKAARKYSLIMLITGKRGSGKTALGMKFLEAMNRETSRKCYAIGFDHTKLPRWLKKAEDTEKVPSNSVVLVDEGAVAFSSRDAMKSPNKLLGKLMAIARHKNLSMILIAQNCMPLDTEILTEKGVRKLGDLEAGEKVFSYNFKTNKIELKESSLFEPEERPAITIETADGDIIKCSPNHKLLVKEGDKVVKKMAKELTEKDELFRPMGFKRT